MDSPEAAEPAPFRLRMDPVPDSVVWGRSFAASLAVAHDADVGSVADLRMAASEIIARIVASGCADSIVIEVTLEDGRLVFEFSPWPVDEADLPPDSFDPWDVVCVLFEEATAGDRWVRVPVELSPAS